METVVFPNTNEKWKSTCDFMKQYLINWNERIKNVSDVINFMRNVLNNLYGIQPDIFKGLGMFLMNLTDTERKDVFNSLKLIVLYATKLESVINIRTFKGLINISCDSLNSILACSFLCLLTQNSEYNLCSPNFDQIYNNILQGNFDQEKWLKRFLYLFQKIDNTEGAFTISSINKPISNNIEAYLTTSSWPVIIHSEISKIHSISSVCWMHLWPSFNERPYNFCCDIPQSLSFLPFILISNYWPSIIQSPYGTHIIACLSNLDPWNLSLQYYSNHINQNLISMASSLNQTESCYSSNINFRYCSGISSNYASFISKRSRSGSSNSEFSFRRQSSTMSTKSSRHSYSSSSRSGSLQISSNSGVSILSSVSSRRSSGRDEEPILSTTSNSVLPSVIEGSGNDGSGATILDQSSNNVTSLNHASRVQQSVIEEEISVIEEDENEALFKITLDDHMGRLMRAPISDSSKLSLSQELFEVFKDAKNLTHRRNSSPLLLTGVNLGSTNRFLLRPPTHVSPQPLRHQISLNNNNSHRYRNPTTPFGSPILIPRCCGEDQAARNRFFSMSNSSFRRRQSLPCHLQSLINTSNFNQQHNTSNIDSNNNNYNNSNNNNNLLPNFNLRINPLMTLSTNTNTTISGSEERLGSTGSWSNNPELINYVDSVVLNILCWTGPGSLSEDILKLRSTKYPEDACLDTSGAGEEGSTVIESASGSNPGIQLTECTDKPVLLSQDLAKFDRELFSSTFFDDEADQCFRKFSDMALLDDLNCDNEPDTNIEDEVDEENKKDIEERKSTNKIRDKKQFGSLLDSLADFISSEIIVESLCECRPLGKTVYPPLIIHSFPKEYNEILSLCLKIIVSGTNRSSDNPRILILELPQSPQHIKEEAQLVLNTILSLQNVMSLAEFYSITLNYFNDSDRDQKFSDYLKQFIVTNKIE